MLIDHITRTAYKIELECIEESCSYVSNTLASAIKKLELRSSKDIEMIDESFKDQLIDSLYDEHWTLASQFPKYQYYSHYLLSYGLFETILNEYCTKAAQKLNSKLKLKDLSGQGIERAKNYLSKVAGLEELFNSSDWQKLKLAGEIRNIIAHTAGNLNYENNKHKELARKLNDMDEVILQDESDYGSEIILSEKFVISTIHVIKRFIRDVGMSEISNK